MKVSIVVPIFNARSYLERCLRSVMAQSCGELECLLVDDGSTDGGLELAERALAAYAGPVEFRILRHDRNRGQSAARNTGIRAATGDYLYFLDSDDEIFPDTVARFAACAGRGDVDFAVGEFEIEGGAFPRWAVRLAAGVHRGRDAILGSYLRSDWQTLVGNRFVRRRFLVDHDLYFAEGLVHEDDLWTLMLACRAESMGVVKGPTYLYRVHGDSTMTANPVRRFENWVRILERMEAHLTAEGLGTRPDALRFVAVRRAELVGRARQAGVNAYAVYRREVRSGRTFDRRAFQDMGIGWKIRYLHCLLPVPVGYAFLQAALRAVPWLARLRSWPAGKPAAGTT
jgi:glycosyltransferase involved in cell wall biosynthesis